MQISFVKPDAFDDSFVPETLGATPVASWFVGLRDDWRNPARPVMNRYEMTWQVTLTFEILTESPTSRREMSDLIATWSTFSLEEQFFTFLGRAVLDRDAPKPDEHYQISVHQEVANQGDGIIPRGGDVKNPIYTTRVSLPCTIWWMIDRPVLVPSGPSAGQSFVVTSDDFTQVDETNEPLVPTPN